jgi:hypothetical protein
MYYFPSVYSSENLRPTIWQAMDKHEKITIYYIKFLKKERTQEYYFTNFSSLTIS